MLNKIKEFIKWYIYGIEQLLYDTATDLQISSVRDITIEDELWLL